MDDVKQPEKPTVPFAAVPDWAIELTRSVNTVLRNVEGLVEDGKGLNLRMAGVEGRLAKLESPPTVPPPPPITSERVRAVIEAHPSQMDLATAAKQAEEIARGTERDRRIEETHALAIEAAEKVTALTESQELQLAILQRVDRFFDLVDKVRKHRVTKLTLGIATLLLAGYATSKGLHIQ